MFSFASEWKVYWKGSGKSHKTISESLETLQERQKKVKSWGAVLVKRLNRREIESQNTED